MVTHSESDWRFSGIGAKIEAQRTCFKRHGMVLDVDGMEPEQGNEMLYAERYARLKRQSAWIIEMARLLEPCNPPGNQRTVRQVKQSVDQFLARLEQEATHHPDEADVIASIVKAVRHGWILRQPQLYEQEAIKTKG